MRGRVIANFGQLVAVRDDEANIIQCKTRRSTGLIVSGDWVEYKKVGSEDYIIEKMTPRRSCLARPDRRNQNKALAANIDQLFIVFAPKPEPDWIMVSAYLVYAAHHNLEATLVLNKKDLLNDENKQTILGWVERYESIGYKVISTCCKSDHGLDTLVTEIEHHTSILVGQSGVGKSSIVKSLLPNQQVQINAISAATGLGSHTTTTTMLYQLANKGELIDSPGVRQFSVEQLDAESIRHGFIEFAPYAGNCQFSDCTHQHEPSCAVLTAVANGDIAKPRWQHYKELLNRAC